jgi:hypothetical protein
MVSYSQAIHAQLFGSGDKLWDAAHTVKQAILGMNMEVCEFSWHFLNYNMGFSTLPFYN